MSKVTAKKQEVDQAAAGEAAAMKGPPAYLASQEVEYLARMNMALLSELWITRDRLALVERLLADQKIIAPNQLDDYVPDEDFAQHLEALRSVVVENVLGAPFKNEETVASLVAKGQELAKLHRRDK